MPLIHPNQSGFIKGRQTSDATRWMRNIMPNPTECLLCFCLRCREGVQQSPLGLPSPNFAEIQIPGPSSFSYTSFIFLPISPSVLLLYAFHTFQHHKWNKTRMPPLTPDIQLHDGAISGKKLDLCKRLQAYKLIRKNTK